MLKYYILSQDKFTLALEIFMPIFVIVLVILRMYLNKHQRNIKIWRMLCLIPVGLCLVHLSLYYIKGAMSFTWSFYGMLYIAAIIIAIWQFFVNKKIGYRVMGAITFCSVSVLCLVNMILQALSNPVIGNYSREDYVESFLSITEEMEEHYCLNEWKEIDYEFLRNTILPEVQLAQQNQDEAGYLVALCKYAYYFHDSHVYVGLVNRENTQIVEEAKNRLAGNDYGFSMITYSNGETVAILVEEESEAYDSGIRAGTRIISWNGLPIEDAKKEIECIYLGSNVHALLENEDKLKAAFLAGKGDDIVTVEFVDSSGNVQVAEIKKMGGYAERLDEFLSRFYCYELDKENFEAEMISDTHGYLRIEGEQYNTISDIKAIFSDDYPEVNEMLHEKLTDLESQGMETLIIDTRNNYGGYNVISAEVASLFTDVGGFNYSFGEYENGEYVLTDKHYYEADGRWKDLEVIVLTNASCMSAGDQLVNLLSECPNVTVIGTTCSSGVNQNNGGICFATNSQFVVAYPFALTLNEEGVPNIDANQDRLNRVLIDEYIPIDDAYVHTVFGDDVIDYEIQYILENDKK